MKTRIFFLVILFIFTAYSPVDIFSIETKDEFKSIEQNDDEFQSVGDDEFQSVEETEFKEIGEKEVDVKVSYNRLWWSVAILLFTMLSGILVRFEFTRKFRPVFLIASIVVLGFYRGGCPGPVSSIQNLYLLGIGVQINWQAIVLFLGLIPVTSIFGKVFCGWVCHLGALQEVLNISKIKILQSEKAQKVMRIIRMVILVVLLIQLTFTHVILWNKIGPFKVAYNLFSANIIGYVLLGILLLSSIFIHRPFCKTICPVGLVLGWVSKIPGASVLGVNESCSSCKTCNSSCQINAITRKDKLSVLDNQECIVCGDCISSCKTGGIKLVRKTKRNYGKVTLNCSEKPTVS
jgi:ferredoxin